MVFSDGFDRLDIWCVNRSHSAAASALCLDRLAGMTADRNVAAKYTGECRFKK